MQTHTRWDHTGYLALNEWALTLCWTQFSIEACSGLFKWHQVVEIAVAMLYRGRVTLRLISVLCQPNATLLRYKNATKAAKV